MTSISTEDSGYRSGYLDMGSGSPLIFEIVDIPHRHSRTYILKEIKLRDFDVLLIAFHFVIRHYKHT